MLAENASDVVVEGDNDGIIQWVSPSVAALLGWRPEQIIGRSLVSLVHAEDHAPLVSVRAAILRGEPQRFEARLTDAFGGHRWTSISVRPIFDEAGAVVGRVGGWRDIQDEVTLRRIADAQRRQLEFLAQHASDVVCVSGADRRLSWVAGSVTQSLGWQPDELCGTVLSDLVHPDDRAEVEARIPSLYQGLSSSIPSDGLLARLRTKQGEYRWMSGSATAMTDESGSVIGVMSGLRDVQELVHARHEIDAERLRMRAIIDAQLDPHLLVEAVRDPEGTIVDFVVREANEVTLETLGRSRLALLGARLSEVWPALLRSTVFGLFVITVESGSPLALDDFAPAGDVDPEGRKFDIRGVRVGDGLSYTWRDVTARYEAARALAEAEAHYQLLANHASDIVFRADSDARISWISPSVRFVLGQEPSDIVGHRATEFVHADDVATLIASTQEVLGERQSRYVARFRTIDGGYRWMSVLVHPVRDAEGNVVGRVGGFRDVQSEVEAQASLRESERRLRLTMEAVPTGLAMVAADTSFVEVNAALCRMLGFDRKWLLSHGLTDVLGPHRDAMDQLLAAAVSGPDGGATNEQRVRRADGTEIWVEHSLGVLYDDDGGVTSYVSQFVDVTAAREDKVELERAARRDTLTQLANRRELVEQIDRLLQSASGADTGVGVAFIDLDGLKPINDDFGHLAGDALLVAIAQRISAVVRHDDLVARFGGDEFVIVLPSVQSIDDVIAVAEHVRRAVAEPIDLEIGTVNVTASVGVTMCRPGEDSTQVLQRADDALYDAKRAGRNRVVVGVVQGPANVDLD